MKYSLAKKILLALIMGGSTLAFSQSYAKKYYATIITDGKPLHDHSVNQSIYDGFLMAKTNYDININYLQSNRKDDFLPNINTAVEDDANIIFGIGKKIANDIVKSAKMHPHNNFVILGVDTSKVTLSNLTGITYAVEQAGYLAGILAGNLTYKYSSISSKLNKQKILGIILGEKNPETESYVAGYIAGVRSIDPTITIVLSTINTFSDQKKAEKTADAMISQGIDIILPVAGTASLGAIRSAQKHNKFIIGVEKDQSIYAPSTVLTSIEKDIKTSVYNLIRTDIVGGNLPTYIHAGFRENAIQLAQFHKFTSMIPKVLKNNIYQAKKKILKNQIQIPHTINKAFSYNSH